MNFNEKESKNINVSSHSPKSVSQTSISDESNLINKTTKRIYPKDIDVNKLSATSKIKSLIISHKLIVSLVAVFSTSAIVTAVVAPTVYASGNKVYFFLLRIFSIFFSIFSSMLI